MIKSAERSAMICGDMRTWFREQEYAGIDPYLLDERVFSARRYPVIGPALGWVRRMLKPLHPWIPRRVFTTFSPVIMPKALGLIVSGNSFLYQLAPHPELLDENRRLLDLLVAHRSPGFDHLCWGQPFSWGSNPRYPPHTPAVCATSPIAHGILDHYDVSGDARAVEMAQEVADYLMLDNGYDDLGDSLCLYYGPTNRDLAFNSNAMAASFLAWLSHVTGDRAQADFAARAVRFVVEGQNEDGSWYYTSAGRNGEPNRTIDNRHTGFVLEHLHIASDRLEDDAAAAAIDRGWDYYQEFLFDGPVPRWAPDQSYPVDIHDVAQAILTPVQLGRLDFAARVVEFALRNLFDGKDQFYYKLFADGRVNQTVFLRWGQAWMYKALGSFALAAHRLQPEHAAHTTGQVPLEPGMEP
ncbi:MAG: hypothetical protein JXA93_24895 [Anaerolineae bacterium]|nr:hypothetical protein [Anaerolineae bacterium]